MSQPSPSSPLPPGPTPVSADRPPGPDDRSFQGFVETISASRESDWHALRGPVTIGGAIYSGALVYRPDIAISMAWSIERSEPFNEPWTHTFQGRAARILPLDLFYCGGLVDRLEIISVDGGRCFLPRPRIALDGTAEVSPSLMRVVRLFYNLAGALEDFDRYVQRAGIVVTGEGWPVDT